MDQELKMILNSYLRDFEQKKQKSFVVKNSIPIVWFGDIEAYQTSETKIVAVGLNPSYIEFPVNKWQRFDIHANNADDLYDTLNRYFWYNPYKQWFSHFERCLNRMDASFGGVMTDTHYDSTAICLDAFSAIATNPTYSKLFDSQKDEIDQQHLFQRLLDYLQPDVILMSVAFDRFVDILDINSPYNPIYKDSEGKIKIYKENGRVMVYGRNMKGQPFGGIRSEVLDTAFNKAYLLSR